MKRFFNFIFYKVLGIWHNCEEDKVPIDFTYNSETGNYDEVKFLCQWCGREWIVKGGK